MERRRCVAGRRPCCRAKRSARVQRCPCGQASHRAFLRQAAFCSTRGAWKAHLVESAGRLPSRRPPVAAARRGGQGRRRLAPGPDPRAATRRPSWAEHGEHGEDPPLDRSEHRGTHPSQPVVPVVHANPRPTNGSLTVLLTVCPAKWPCFLLQSGRAFSCKVAVDKSLIHTFSPQGDCASQGTLMTMPVRPLTGGGLCRSAMPRPSNSMSAARYWLCTSRTVCRNTALKLSMRS